MSVRNLAKTVTDDGLRKVAADAAAKGLQKGLVTDADLAAQDDAQSLNGPSAGPGSGSSSFGAAAAARKKASKSPKMKLTGAKVMRDLDHPDQPSAGYGFVEFESHQAALAMLRWLNNNPAYSSHARGGAALAKTGRPTSEWPRLICEFTVENRTKVQQKAARETQAKAPKREKKRAADGDDAEKHKGRGALQREKKRRRAAGDDSAAEAGGAAGAAAAETPGTAGAKKQRVNPHKLRKQERKAAKAARTAEREKQAAAAETAETRIKEAREEQKGPKGQRKFEKANRQRARDEKSSHEADALDKAERGRVVKIRAAAGKGGGGATGEAGGGVEAGGAQPEAKKGRWFA